MLFCVSVLQGFPLLLHAAYRYTQLWAYAFTLLHHYWAPRGCFHHFPLANVLSSEAVISYELASGGDCLVVVIHHLFGRGD